jgi:hypothetical protein
MPSVLGLSGREANHKGWNNATEMKHLNLAMGSEMGCKLGPNNSNPRRH